MSTPTKPKHSPTPGPWREYNQLNGRSLNAWRIHQAGTPKDICTIAKSLPGYEQVANAAHIVRCVNGWDALIDTLTDELNALRIWRRAAQGDVAEGIEISIDKIERALAAALKQAEGKGE